MENLASGARRVLASSPVPIFIINYSSPQSANPGATRWIFSASNTGFAPVMRAVGIVRLKALRQNAVGFLDAKWRQYLALRRQRRPLAANPLTALFWSSVSRSSVSLSDIAQIQFCWVTSRKLGVLVGRERNNDASAPITIARKLVSRQLRPVYLRKDVFAADSSGSPAPVVSSSARSSTRSSDSGHQPVTVHISAV